MEHHFSEDPTGSVNPRVCQMCAGEMVAARIVPARLGINARSFECPHCNGGLNGSTQHFILKGKDGV